MAAKQSPSATEYDIMFFMLVSYTDWRIFLASIFEQLKLLGALSLELLEEATRGDDLS